MKIAGAPNLLRCSSELWVELRRAIGPRLVPSRGLDGVWTFCKPFWPFFVGNFVGNFVERVQAAADAMLTHHKLKVYEKALALGASAPEFSSRWGRRHAIADHFCRAAESIVLNIAEGARLRSGPDKARTLDYALGSTLECAACLDIATIKEFLSRESSLTEKRRLSKAESPISYVSIRSRSPLPNAPS